MSNGFRFIASDSLNAVICIPSLYLFHQKPTFILNIFKLWFDNEVDLVLICDQKVYVNVLNMKNTYVRIS